MGICPRLPVRILHFKNMSALTLSKIQSENLVEKARKVVDAARVFVDADRLRVIAAIVNGHDTYAALSAEVGMTNAHIRQIVAVLKGYGLVEIIPPDNVWAEHNKVRNLKRIVPSSDVTPIMASVIKTIFEA